MSAAIQQLSPNSGLRASAKRPACLAKRRHSGRAFDIHALENAPILYRPRAGQFVQFFDSKQIPVLKEQL